MNSRIALASLATLAAFATAGAATAGELYPEAERSFTPSIMTPPVSIAGYTVSGELYGFEGGESFKPVTITPRRAPVHSSYALGGELYNPIELNRQIAGQHTDTNKAE